MPHRLRKAVVTGTSSGIGRAIADKLLLEGVGVVGLSRRTVGPQDDRFEHRAVDLGDLDSLAAVAKEIVAEHPDADAVVLNAGRGEFGSLEEFSYSQMRALLDLNFTSQAFLARAFLPSMKRRGGGHLVFIGSEAAHRGSQKGALYCASKFALRGFAQALRQEVSTAGLRVSFVSPAMTATAFYDRLDFGPGDAPENALDAATVADAVWLCLASPAGSVIDEIELSPLKRVVQRRSSISR
jgi:3-hydroxy acid dehydrogenase/malonic semialdehyde reductase